LAIYFLLFQQQDKKAAPFKWRFCKAHALPSIKAQRLLFRFCVYFSSWRVRRRERTVLLSYQNCGGGKRSASWKKRGAVHSSREATIRNLHIHSTGCRNGAGLRYVALATFSNGEKGKSEFRRVCRASQAEIIISAFKCGNLISRAALSYVYCAVAAVKYESYVLYAIIKCAN